MGESLDRIPVETLQQAFIDSKLTASEVARRMEWRRGKGGPVDASRFRRKIGLTEHHSGKGGYYTQSVTYAEAVDLIRAMGRYPVDYGL
jgi:hypothetical protein